MDPITLEQLISTEVVEMLPDGLRVAIASSWIVPGEDRLSYTSAIRLAECCREHHWRTDFARLAPRLDSIVSRCIAAFRKPMLVDSHLEVRYAVTRVGRRSYDCTVAFLGLDEDVAERRGDVVLTSVFYDPERRCAIDPPSQIKEVLLGLLKRTQDHGSS